eukprot:1606814-Rhodomonas_salina.1
MTPAPTTNPASRSRHPASSSRPLVRSTGLRAKGCSDGTADILPLSGDAIAALADSFASSNRKDSCSIDWPATARRQAASSVRNTPTPLHAAAATPAQTRPSQSSSNLSPPSAAATYSHARTHAAR